MTINNEKHAKGDIRKAYSTHRQERKKIQHKFKQELLAIKCTGTFRHIVHKQSQFIYTPNKLQ